MHAPVLCAFLPPCLMRRAKQKDRREFRFIITHENNDTYPSVYPISLSHGKQLSRGNTAGCSKTVRSFTCAVSLFPGPGYISTREHTRVKAHYSYTFVTLMYHTLPNSIDPLPCAPQRPDPIVPLLILVCHRRKRSPS